MENTPRKRILAHATGRFMTAGFSRVTMDQIARELGLSKKTLYSHFPSKQQLLLAAIRGQLGKLKLRLDEAFEAPGLPFTERFDRLLQAAGAQLAAVGQPLVDDLYRRAPRVWREIEQFRRVHVFDRLEQLLRQGIREGHVRSDLRPPLVVLIITQVAQAALNPAQLVALGASLSEVLASVMALLYHGVLTERGRRGMQTHPGGSRKGGGSAGNA